MWWLLVVPVIGAVAAALANSDDEDKEEAERRARTQAREAEGQAIVRRKQADLKKRKAQLVTDVSSQLDDLFSTHPAVLDRADQGALNVSFDNLRTFASKKVPRKPKAMLKHLEAIAPGITFSPVWTQRAVQAQTLQKEITGLQRLKEELLG